MVDDDPIVRAALHSLLGRSGRLDVVASFGDGRDAVSYAAVHFVDVYVVDLSMPVMDGVSTSMSLKQTSPNSNIILLSCAQTDVVAAAALAAGAVAFLPKTSPPSLIVEKIIQSHRDGAIDSAGDARRAPVLSVRERDVLKELCRGKSNREIAEELFLSEMTVKSHVHSIMRKLDAKSRLMAAVIAIDSGLIWG